MMSQDQKKFLLGQLNDLTGWNGRLKKELKLPTFPKTPEVRAWERKKKSFDRKQERMQKAYRANFEKATTAVRQEIYFGTPESALAKLNALKKKFA